MHSKRVKLPQMFSSLVAAGNFCCLEMGKQKPHHSFGVSAEVTGLLRGLAATAALAKVGKQRLSAAAGRQRQVSHCLGAPPAVPHLHVAHLHQGTILCKDNIGMKRRKSRYDREMGQAI